MTGEIIHFQSHLDLKRGELHGKQTVPRDAAAAPRLNEPGVARPSEIPAPASHRRSRAGGKDGRRILHTLPWSEHRADLADDGEVDPQPDIDYETLDRMYRVLNSSN